MSIINNKKIAKNTLMLYIRMLLLMAVSLYTSRVVLKVLGVDDYGIYNLVGGFISVFSFVSAAMVSAIQRFFNVAIGENDQEMYMRIYSMGMNMFMLFSLFLIVIAGTAGTWFVATQLNIPAGRETAAMWVFWLSLITSIVQLFRSPDNASIIAYEEMGFYAYISIIEAVLKLAIVFLLARIDTDKLLLYCWLYLGTTVIINAIYKFYVNRRFSACRYKRIWDKRLLKQLTFFSGWSLLAQGAHITQNQGESFLTNHYFNVSVNAARGVSAQVYNAVNLFLINFQTGFRPQLIQSYAAGELEEHQSLIYRTGRLSFFLLAMIVFPVIFNIDGLLRIWLVEVPPYTRDFVIYICLAYLFDAIGSPFATSVNANGNIKGLMIWSSILYLIGLVLSFLGFKLLNIPYITAIVCIIVHAIIVVIDVFYARHLCGVGIKLFLKETMSPIMIAIPLMIGFPLLIGRFVSNLWISILLDVIVMGLTALVIGLKKNERQMIVRKVFYGI